MRRERSKSESVISKPVVENISNADLSKILKENIREYGLSLIEDRMIPSIRDGFKPAQRRLLKVLYDLKVFSKSPMVKSARVTGDCMGKYHPHSDSYEVLVGLVNQNCSLLEGQGNWGSYEEDAAAARYTECRLNPLGEKLFEDYANTSEEVPNFTGEYMEPIDIPTELPLFFINSSTGIGVAVRMDIPDHNMIEVLEAFKVLIELKDKCTIDDLFKVFHGPDSKYGGRLLTTKDELKAIYESGNGQITYECTYDIDRVSGNKQVLTVTEYCPKFNINSFKRNMLKLYENKIISEFNDVSDKEHLCRFEVIYSDPEVFEKYIHRHLICSQTVQYYGLLRLPSETPELRDIDSKFISGGLLGYMNIWLDWRRERESYRIKNKINTNMERLFKLRCRLEAILHMDLIQKALNSLDVDKELINNLPLLQKCDKSQAKMGAECISDLKISSLKRMDESTLRKEIESKLEEIESLKSDLVNIDKVIYDKLTNLEKFGKTRKLRI